MSWWDDSFRLVNVVIVFNNPNLPLICQRWQVVDSSSHVDEHWYLQWTHEHLSARHKYVRLDYGEKLCNQ